MRRVWAAAGLMVLAGIVVLVWKAGSPPESQSEADMEDTAPTVVAAAPEVASGGKASTQEEQARAGSPLVDELLHREGGPDQDLEIVRQLISQYVTAMQNQPGPPIGDNADLVRALTGRNPLQLVVIPPGHPALGGDGQLRDRWGMPYHLHPLSGRSYEIRSAGPDRRLFTADDLIVPRTW